MNMIKISEKIKKEISELSGLTEFPYNLENLDDTQGILLKAYLDWYFSSLDTYYEVPRILNEIRKDNPNLGWHAGIEKYIDNINKLENCIIDNDLIRNSFYNIINDFTIKNASGILIAGAYKEGIIYGLNPKNGNILEFEFSRATGATLFDSNFNLQIVTSNIPRTDFGNYSNSNPKILIEKEATNYVKDSQLITKLDETFNGVFTRESIDWLEFLKNGVNIKPASSGITNAYRKRVDIPDEEKDYSFSVFAKMHDNSEPVFNNIRADSNGLLVMFNGGIRPKSTFLLNNNIFRIHITRTLPNAAKWCAAYMYPNNYGDGYNVTGYQLEDSVDSTSFIPTTDSEVTRAADHLSYMISTDCSVLINTTKQKVILDKTLGKWNIEQDLNNEGIYSIAIFDRILSKEEKKQLLSQRL